MGREKTPGVAIIGLGAVGGVLTAGLLENDPGSLRVIVKEKYLPALRKEGLTIQNKTPRYHPLRPYAAIDFSLIDTLVVPLVKAYDLPAVIRQLAPRAFESTRLLLLQNGIGIREKISAWSNGKIPDHRIYRGVVAFGATLTAPGKVRYFDGRMVVEEKFRKSPWFSRFENSLFALHTTRHLRRVLWKKLLVNSIYNPLSLILRASNRTLSAEGLDPLKAQLLREGLEVAAAEGIKLDLTVRELNRMVLSDNLTSMYQDFQYGRPTEIDFITGALIRKAEAHALPVPAHRLLGFLVRAAVRIRDAEGLSPARES